jgi:hypothetical protein
MFGKSILRGWLVACLVPAASMTTGCGSRSPKVKTYPVSGAVVYRGGAPLAGGSIRFHSLRDAAVVSGGDIKEDGTFSLHTLVDKDKVAGTAEGAYRVTVLPPLPADHKTVVRPVTLVRTFQVEAKENQFTIEVAPLRRSP